MYCYFHSPSRRFAKIFPRVGAGKCFAGLLFSLRVHFRSLCTFTELQPPATFRLSPGSHGLLARGSGQMLCLAAIFASRTFPLTLHVHGIATSCHFSFLSQEASMAPLFITLSSRFQKSTLPTAMPVHSPGESSHICWFCFPHNPMGKPSAHPSETNLPRIL